MLLGEKKTEKINNIVTTFITTEYTAETIKITNWNTMNKRLWACAYLYEILRDIRIQNISQTTGQPHKSKKKIWHIFDKFPLLHIIQSKPLSYTGPPHIYIYSHTLEVFYPLKLISWFNVNTLIPNLALNYYAYFIIYNVKFNSKTISNFEGCKNKLNI